MSGAGSVEVCDHGFPGRNWDCCRAERDITAEGGRMGRPFERRAELSAVTGLIYRDPPRILVGVLRLLVRRYGLARVRASLIYCPGHWNQDHYEEIADGV
jgi:hypothetical protein